MDADVVVIGSGAGGLAAALPLAQAGKRVIVVEQHEVPGGLCHSFRQNRYRFSPGIHYVGQAGEGGYLRAIYEGLGIAEDIDFLEMNPHGYEHVIVGDQRFDIPAGKEAVTRAFCERFPAEAKNIEAYFTLVEKICSQISLIPETRSFLQFLTIPFRTRDMGRYGLYTLQRIFNDRFTDPYLKAFLAVQCGDHGLPPSKVPFGYHAAVAGHYLSGAYYPRGGGRAIPRAFVRGLKKHNAKLMLKTSVQSILTEKTGKGHKAIGVLLDNGAEIRCETVISNAAPNITYQQMIGRDKLSNKLKNKLDKATYTSGALMLFLATDMDLAGMGYDSGNYWYCDTPDVESYYRRIQDKSIVDADELPGAFIGITTLKDPESFRNGHHVIEAVSFITYDVFAQWQDTRPDERPEQYHALKAKLTAAMLKTVERVIPGLSDYLLHCDLATPLSSDYYVRSAYGSAYGAEKVKEQLGPMGFHPRTEVENLFLCGSSTTGHGLTGAASTGLAVASTLLKCRPSELYKETGQHLKVIPSPYR